MPLCFNMSHLVRPSCLCFLCIRRNGESKNKHKGCLVPGPAHRSRPYTYDQLFCGFGSILPLPLVCERLCGKFGKETGQVSAEFGRCTGASYCGLEKNFWIGVCEPYFLAWSWSQIDALIFFSFGTRSFDVELDHARSCVSGCVNSTISSMKNLASLFFPAI